jgi:plastocyanin
VRIRIVLAVAGLAAVLAVVGSASARSTVTTLKGTVGPGFTITLKNASGKKVTTLKHGTYRIVVSDKASIHNFVLEGPGVEKDITTVGFTGTKTVTVKLRVGKYKYYCRPHESAMFGFVKVT